MVRRRMAVGICQIFGLIPGMGGNLLGVLTYKSYLCQAGHEYDYEIYERSNIDDVHGRLVQYTQNNYTGFRGWEIT